MNWNERLEFIKKKIKEELAKNDLRDTDENVAAFLDISAPTYSKIKRNRQFPDFKTCVNMAAKLHLSANWLLLGFGEPDISAPKTTSRCDVHIADTLRDLISEIGKREEEIAITGGMYPRDLQMIINRVMPLPVEAVQKWVHAYHINANFLIAQVGRQFLTEEEYRADGPLTWVRERRGDILPYDDEGIDSQDLERLRDELNQAKQTVETQKNIIAAYETALAAQKETLAAKEESLALYRERIEAPRGDSAPGTDNAVPLSRRGTE